jgi:hypothetical protein
LPVWVPKNKPILVMEFPHDFCRSNSHCFHLFCKNPVLGI